MSVKHNIHKALNKVVAKTADLVAAKKLPTFINGQLTFLPRGCWRDVVMRIENEETRILSEHLNRGGCFWDIGAHHGLISLHASRAVGNRGHVVAVEPEPGNFALLQQTLARVPGAQFINAGAGSALGELTFYSNGAVSYGSFVDGVTAINLRYGTDPEIRPIPCPIITLDSLSQKYPAPNLVKVDVEGFEVEVLKGARKLLAEGQAAWLIEIHPTQLTKNGQSPAEVESILKKNGYRPEHLGQRVGGGTYLIFAPPAL